MIEATATRLSGQTRLSGHVRETPLLSASGLELAAQAAAAGVSQADVLIPCGGAVALAAALFHGDAVTGDAVIVIGSGGNVAAETFRMALRQSGEMQ